jgi:predicted transposase YbfD/YdcC
VIFDFLNKVGGMAMEGPGCAIFKYFGDIKDPRIDRKKRHKLIDIIILAICGVMCGADGWEEIEEICKASLDKFRGFLELPNGIPSHDTIGRVFSRLDPEGLQDGFCRWIQSVREGMKADSEQIGPENVGIDGKTLRRSFERAAKKGKNPIHMVSAWANQARIVLGQVKTEEKSNEIKAIPELLALLELTGCIVTIDAMGCQKSIAQEILNKGADYVLALKGNQGDLARGVELGFEIARAKNFAGIDYGFFEESGLGHGRQETRRYWLLSDLHWLPDAHKWPGMKSVCMVESTRSVKGKECIELRHYITSLSGNVEQVGKAIRNHWGVENSLHWVLDVTFREDECRIRNGHAAENFAVLRRIALNLFKREPSKHSIKRKRLLACLHFDYLITALNA